MYFTSFSEGQQDWLGVVKIKACSIIQSFENNKPEVAYQDDDEHQIVPIVVANGDFAESLVDTHGIGQKVPIDWEEEEDIEFMWSSEEEFIDKDIEEERLQEEEDDNYEAYQIGRAHV